MSPARQVHSNKASVLLLPPAIVHQPDYSQHGAKAMGLVDTDGGIRKDQCMPTCLLLLVMERPVLSQSLQVLSRALAHLRQGPMSPLCTRNPLPRQPGATSPWPTLQTLLYPKLPRSQPRQPSQGQLAAFLQVGCLAAND